MVEINWDKMHELSDYKTLEEYSNNYQVNRILFKDVKEEISFLYEIGLFYSIHFEEHNRMNLIFRSDEKYYLPIYFYLKAIQLYNENKLTIENDFYFMQELIRRLFVNIANEYSNQFRSISALKYYRLALDIDQYFDMAIGNFALGIEHHTPLLGLETKESIKVFDLIFSLYDDVVLGNLDRGHDFFVQKKIQYERIFESYISGNPPKYFQGIQYERFRELKDSESYENWSAENTLFLNYINDLGKFEESRFDIDIEELNSVFNISEDRVYSLKNMFNIFKVQRRKIYDNRNLNSDNSIYEIAQAFQTLYSFFDKTAYFLYKYFKITGKERDININRIWKMKNELGHNLLAHKNQYLYNIYWLRKEYNGKVTLK